MGKPAARIGDNHNCTIARPLPHKGGPILTGAATVLICQRPAARVTDKALCRGQDDVIATGSATVLIEGLPAARIGDRTVHDGVIVEGAETVLIGG
ncbi:PAAR domain-containing protein [Phenylobacterium sp.]|uniref:PAAR domain-containing protein n=1 Tax=Phenylobacterium sp. TaxID=1871053 RepID=UPI00286C358B|nr:PAAR domain-containing protein [Phenylobacterium sp.]